MPKHIKKPPATLPPLVGSLLGPALDDAEARASGKIKPIPLPFPALGRGLGGGLWPGLYVLAAVPGAGKTQLMAQVAMHAARNDTPVLFVQLEQTQDEMAVRLYAVDAGLMWSDVQHGRDAKDVELLRDAAKKSSPPLRVWVPNQPPTIDELEAVVRAFVKAHGSMIGSTPALVVVDYLQLLAGVGTDARQRVGDASSALSRLARKYNAAVIAVSSIARTGYAASSKSAPSAHMAASKESGEVEYAADAVICMIAEDTKSTTKKVTLMVAKLRHGCPGSYRLTFDGSRFTELTVKSLK